VAVGWDLQSSRASPPRLIESQILWERERLGVAIIAGRPSESRSGSGDDERGGAPREVKARGGVVSGTLYD